MLAKGTVQQFNRKKRLDQKNVEMIIEEAVK